MIWIARRLPAPDLSLGDSTAVAQSGGGGGGGGMGRRGDEDIVAYITVPPDAPRRAVTAAVPIPPRPKPKPVPVKPVPSVASVPVPPAPPVADTVARAGSETDTSAVASGSRGSGGNTDSGSGGGEGGGVGTGTGTGTGGGTGAGTGAGSGEGRSGGGGRLVPPEPRQLVLPPPDYPKELRGRTFAVTFWVDARGRVERIGVTPAIEQRGFAKTFEETMRNYRFRPARSPEGQSVPGSITVNVAFF